MISRVKRIVWRTDATIRDATEPSLAHGNLDTLISEATAGLRRLDAIKADLRWREQALMSDASALYAQLTNIATALAYIHEQQSIACELEEKLTAALATFEPPAPSGLLRNQRERSRQEALVSQAHD